MARSEEHLARFEAEGSVENFFYAALELRFGIEARLNEYLSSAYEAIGRDPKEIDEYVASKLLKKLISIDPRADRETTLRITSNDTGRSTVLQFTPVTPRLASIHGQLGELLHFSFFQKNEHWMLKTSFGGKPRRTLSDFVLLLKEGILELRQATSGALLRTPRFTAIVQEIMNEDCDAEDADKSANNELQLTPDGAAE